MSNSIKLLILFLFFLSCDYSTSKYEHVKLNIYRNADNETYVYETFAVGIGKVYRPIPHNLNIESAVDFGEWLVDDSTIFAWYETSDGRLLIENKDADRATFTVLDSSIYAKDKNHIYDTRHGIIENADVETFEAFKINVDGRIVFGKDKNNYFFWDEVITDTLGFAKAYKERMKEKTLINPD